MEPDDGRGGGGLAEDLQAIRSMLSGAETPQETRIILRSRVQPWLSAEEGDEAVLPRPVIRTLTTILIEAGLAPNASNHSIVLRAVDEVINVAAKNTARLPVFSEVFATVLGSTISRCTYDQSRICALHISCSLIEAVLKQTPEVDLGSQEWMTKLITTQASLIDSLLFASKFKHREAINHQLGALWLSHKAVLPGIYRTKVLAMPGVTGVGLLSVLVRYYTAHDKAGFDQALKKEGSELYIKEVINAKSKPGQDSLASFGPLLESLSHEDFGELIQPSLEKAIKKSPAGVLQALVSLTAQVGLDMSRYVDPMLLSPMLRMLRSLEEEPRIQALAVMVNLAPKISDPAVMLKVVTEVTGVLQGKAGVLAQWFQRHAAVSVLRALGQACKSFPSESRQPIATVALEGLTLVLAKEAHDATRAALLASVGEWLSQLDTLPPTVLELFKKGISSSKKDDQLAYLVALREAIAGSTGSTLRPQLLVLVEPLRTLVKEAQKRAGQAIPEAVVALHLLMDLSTADPSLYSKLLEGSFGSMFTDKASWLFSPAMMEALSAANGVSGVDLAVAPVISLIKVLLLAFRLYGGASGLFGATEDFSGDESLGVRNVRPAGVALIDILLHPATVVRNECAAAVQMMLQGSEAEAEASVSLLKAFWVKLDVWARKEEETKKKAVVAKDDDDRPSTPSAASGGGLPTVIPPPSRFFSALKTLVPPDSPPAALPLVLLLSHHPMVCSSLKRAEGAWAIFAANLGGHEIVTEALTDLSQDTIDECFSAVQSEVASHRIASHRALRTLAHEFEEEGWSQVEELVAGVLRIDLERPEVHEITDLDVAIYRTPPGALCQKVADKKDESEGGSKNRRQRSGRRGQLYDAEDEKWEEEFRKKQSKEKGPGGPSAEEVKLLAEEAEIRARIAQIKHETDACLEAMAAVARYAPSIGHAALPEVLPVIQRLLTTPLFADMAYTTLRALATCVEETARPVAWDLAAGVRLVTVEKSRKRLTALSDVLSRSVGYLSGLCSDTYGEQLSGQTFCLLLPILQTILTDRVDGPPYFEALAILAAHARMGVKEHLEEEEDEDKDPGHQFEVKVGPSQADVLRKLRKPMIDIVLEVLRAHPRAEPPPEGILATLLSGPVLSASEWTPLLNEAGLLSEEVGVRRSVLKCIHIMTEEVGGAALQRNPVLEARLWFARFDEESENAGVADQIWGLRGGALSAMYATSLLPLLSHAQKYVRTTAAKALAAGMQELPETAAPTITKLMEIYTNAKPKTGTRELDQPQFLMLPPEEKEKARKAEEAKEEQKWASRSGVATALEEAGKAGVLEEEGSLDTAFPFLLQHGVVDVDGTVRQQMVAAGMAMIDTYGPTHATSLLPIFEEVLDTSDKEAAAKGELQAFDWRREGAVVFVGATARHLDKSDPKIMAIMDKLLEALSTPSESVQTAVALCMVPLMPALKVQAPEIAQRLLGTCLRGESYGERRGAAYGISALVKGLGISSLKQHGIMAALEEAAASPLVPAKQGALFAFECLCDRLKLLFEPYVIVILPLLLRCFADASDHVRDAANLTAKAVMANLSPHGVKLVLPTILKALEDSAWRSKTAAITLLGAMAYCAPKQLGGCLPQIVPKMTEAFGDAHPKVREAGKHALADIGNVIRNPEIRKLSPTLLASLYDPAKKTGEALDALLECEFMHSVDAPSLALLIPIVQRGLKDRSAELKRKAALITGNMCSMISDARDLIPYLPAINPGLQATLVDPIPDVRATSARALGSLMRGMGEAGLPTLIPWLIDTLKSDTSSVERSGGAQGLSEVLVSLGDARVKTVLTDLLALRGHPKFAVREGLLWVLSFLPPALGPGFAPYLGSALEVIIEGLSDEAESVREVALRAGQVLVSTHGKHHANELLPSLEAGLFHENWRIRQSSIQLLGDLLYTIGGTKAVGLADDLDEDAARGSSRAELAIQHVLGPKRRARILASLYIIRSDTSAVVRQAALQVWKTIVSNTPRALKEVLSTLIEIIVTALASGSQDKRTVAGRALADIVRKLGDHILPEIVPILRKELETGDTNMREGVCLGLAEIMEVATKQQLQDFAGTLITAIMDALSDSNAFVREQAAQAFLAFHRIIGGTAIEGVLPPLLDQLDREVSRAEATDHEPSRSLLAITELLRVRPREVLSYLLPRLVRQPISISCMRTLEVVAEVTGPTIHYHVPTILPVLLSELVAMDSAPAPDERRLAALQSSLTKLVTSVEAGGIQSLTIDLTKAIDTEEPSQRKWAVWAIEQFASGTSADFRPQAPIFLKNLLPLFNDTDASVVPASVSAVRALHTKLGMEEAVSHLDFIRNILASVVSDARRRKGGIGDAEFFLPGLNVTGGLESLWPVYHQGLTGGNAQLRESAASALGELVALMTPQALKPYVIKVTGPLIRVAGDKFPPSVKSAILKTLGLLLEKGGVGMKAFAPQLQTTFTKALSDPTRSVRQQAAAGLGKVIQLSARTDPLVNELVNGALNPAGGLEVQAAMLEALTEVLSHAGEKLAPATVSKAVDQLSSLCGFDDDALRSAACSAAGNACLYLPDDLLESKLRQDLLQPPGSHDHWTVHHGKLLQLGHLLRNGGPRMGTYRAETLSFLKRDLKDDHAPIRAAATDDLVALVEHTLKCAGEEVPGLLSDLAGDVAKALADESPDVRRAAALLVKKAAKGQPAALRPHNLVIIPPLLEGVKDSNIRVKYLSERAMLHALEIHTRPETLNEFIAKGPAEPARFVRDYARRVLIRLAAESDDEEGEGGAKR